MTLRDHNRTLGIIHGLLGTLVLVGLAVTAVSEARRHPADALERLRWMLYVLPLPLLQLLTGFGLLKARRWGRILAFVLSVAYVWVFPLGTLLAVYTIWFLQGEGARQLYKRSSDSA
jgi:glycerol uptake facilitator-like aquaporin